MQLTKREKKIKYLVYCLVILAAALLQNIGGLWFEIGSARCFFLLPVAVILGIDEDERIAAMIGGFAGLLWDMVSVQHAGFNFVFLTLMCYIISAFVSYIFRPTYWVNAISSILLTLLYCVLYWLIFVLPKGRDGSAAVLAQFYLPCFVYTSVISMILCGALQSLKRKLNKDIKVE